MEKASEQAALTAAHQEKSYGDYLNKRSSIRNFSTSDQVIFMSKKDDSLPVCVDYRVLNSITISDDIPMEDSMKIMQSTKAANIITTLDLLKASLGHTHGWG
ncbi:hypothetical protein CEXT_483861 [Caerostris extrusa]|uniref:Uncharacterized protein n=1 Tax=Caerostris extrusa TaxID=172846 RepID=A0AAV4S7C9_CAEEX|nr:hypothetical protein CEXT_483861 [Caerostris extrusa]